MKGKNLELVELRQIIDTIDDEIIELIFERMGLMGDVVEYKMKNNLPILDKSREKEILMKIMRKADEYGLSEKFVKIFYQAIMDEAKRIQEEIMNGVKK